MPVGGGHEDEPIGTRAGGRIWGAHSNLANTVFGLDQTGHIYTENRKPNRTEPKYRFFWFSVSTSVQIGYRLRLGFQTATEPINQGTDITQGHRASTSKQRASEQHALSQNVEAQPKPAHTRKSSSLAPNSQPPQCQMHHTPHAGHSKPYPYP